MRLFFQMLCEYTLRKYEWRKEYWRFRAELEIYKQEKLSEIKHRYDNTRNI